MQKRLRLGEQTIEYTLKSSLRSRAIRLLIHEDGRIVATKPRFIPEYLVESFILRKASWVLEKIAHIARLPKRITGENKKQRYQTHKEQARALVNARLAHFNQFYQFTFHRVSIKDQKTCWGSCSKKGNLNFNYRIALIPSHLADYIIVHELCHLKELNHSARFWSLVAETIPNYRVLRHELKQQRLRAL